MKKILVLLAAAALLGACHKELPKPKPETLKHWGGPGNDVHDSTHVITNH